MSAASDPKTSTTAQGADADRTVAMRTAPHTPHGPEAPQSQEAPAASSNVLPPGTRLAEFTVVDVIGEGGFGIVYRAEDRALRRTVAIKEYMPSALAARLADTRVVVKSEQHRETFEIGLKSFINEARLLAQFDHPALVRVFRFWAANGTAYMAMPLYEGGTLKQALKRMDAPPDEAWLKKLLVPLLDAIELLHQADCLHRDIAPDNVIMGPGSTQSTPHPVLLDFGAARRVIGGINGNATQALTVILKPGYAPIEQYDEIPGMKQGPWTDLYALGAVIHSAITGRPPPPSVGRLVQDAWVPLSQAAAGRYSAGFLAAVDGLLAARPDARPRSVAQWRAMLMAGGAAGALPALPAPMPSDAGAGDLTRATLPPATSHRAARRPTRWLRAAAVGALVGSVIIGAAWVVLTQPTRDAQRAQVAALTRAAGAASQPPSKGVPGGTDATTPPAATTPREAAGAAATAAAPAGPRSPPASPASSVPPSTLPSTPPATAPSPTSGASAAVTSATPPVAGAASPAAASTAARTPQRGGEGNPAPPLDDASARRTPPSATPAAPVAASDVVPTAWIDIALREGRACFAARQYACTIARAEAVLKSEPAHAAAQAMLRDGRAAQEAALAGDWKMR
jgi:hypothetical protein